MNVPSTQLTGFAGMGATYRTECSVPGKCSFSVSLYSHYKNVKSNSLCIVLNLVSGPAVFVKVKSCCYLCHFPGVNGSLMGPILWPSCLAMEKTLALHG